MKANAALRVFAAMALVAAGVKLGQWMLDLAMLAAKGPQSRPHQDRALTTHGGSTRADAVTEASMESFPASDPPSFSPGIT